MALAPILPLCEFLQTSPSAAQIHENVANFTATSNVEELALISTLLKHTVPEVYAQLPEETQAVIASKFGSAIGLGNLVARIDLISKERGMVDLLNVHTSLLGRVLTPGIVHQCCKNALSAREVEKLLYKGRCYSILREVDMKHDNVYIPPVLTSMAAYSTFLTHELLPLHSSIEITQINSFVLSLLALSVELQRPFFDVMFHRHNAPFLQGCVAKMKRFERKHMLVKFLDFAAARYLQSSIDLNNVAALYVLTTTVFDAAVTDELFCETIISRYNYALDHVLALIVRRGHDNSAFYNLVLKLMVSWGNSGVMSEEPIVRQEFRTHLLLCMCQQLSLHGVRDLMKETHFVNAISARLTSLSNRVKSLGVVLADALSELAATEKIFSMNGEALDARLPLTSILTSDVMFDADESWDILEAPQIDEIDDGEETGGVGEIRKSLEPVKLGDDEKMKDEKMQDEDDDPTLASEKPVAAPMYVRDILAYLSADSKSPSAYLKQKVALQTAPTLLRQKLNFGSEVAFYAEELLTVLAALTNQYEENDFETARLNAMIAVVVSFPPVATHLCHLLSTGDYSLQQRMCLLSALSLGARELRGYRDDAVSASFTRTSFPSKKLPPSLHNQYLAMETAASGYSRIENSIQNELMADVADEAQNEIAGGKILRISSTLRKPKPKSDVVVSKDQLAHFNKIVGKQFFFPLVAVWYESLGIDIGPYTSLLVSHFVRTLSILLHTGYPAATDLADMAREYIQLVTPVIQRCSVDELQVIESIVTGVMLMFEIFDDTYLVVNFENHLTVIESVVGGWWESLIDERVKSLCAGVMLRISRLRVSMERTIIDQASGFY